MITSTETEYQPQHCVLYRLESVDKVGWEANQICSSISRNTVNSLIHSYSQIIAEEVHIKLLSYSIVSNRFVLKIFRTVHSLFVLTTVMDSSNDRCHLGFRFHISIEPAKNDSVYIIR